MSTLVEAAEVHPVELETVKVYITPSGSPVIL